MSNLKIENEHSLKNAFKRGLNLFVGAGFSIEAKDKTGNKLPLGSALLNELCNKFDKRQSDLPRLSTILEKTQKKDFYDYLSSRFTVDYFPDFYTAINEINIKSIYTTNIDDLIPKIIFKSKNKYVNNQLDNGESTDNNSINYLPLHGSVEKPEIGYVFGVASLANIYNNTQRIWSVLSQSIERYPTIFIGYSFNDSSTIQSLTSQSTFNNAQKEKWIVLHESDEEEAEYYQSMGFSIIISDTESFLRYIQGATENIQQTKVKDNKSLERIFKANIVPKDSRNIVRRPIHEFFRGQLPSWSDIINNTIFKTSYYNKVLDSIFSPHHTIVIGAPVTGKTTLMMQIAYNIQYEGEKLIFNSLSLGKAEYIAKIVDHKPVLIFVENFTDDVEAFLFLSKRPNIKLVGVDRGHNYGIVNHLLEDNFNVINVTDLKDIDIQGIFDSLPIDIKRGTLQKERNLKYEKDSIFEFVIRNIKGQNIKERYADVLKTLEKDDRDLAEFLILCAYMHMSRVPLSIEVACSYFNEYSYNEVYQMRDDLGDILTDYDPSDLIASDMDYYYPRSYFTAETLIQTCPNTLLSKVLNTVIDDIPTIQICDFHTFRKYAFDKNLVLKAFPKWKEGKNFYERAFLYDFKNPYILQQGALYLSARGIYDIAFSWIDRAITMTNNRFFSIRNSHAMILFDANYSVSEQSAEKELDRSMEILQKCMDDDKRKTFHALIYSDQAIRYRKRYINSKSIEYLSQAQKWLKIETTARRWDHDLRNKLQEVDDMINLL